MNRYTILQRTFIVTTYFEEHKSIQAVQRKFRRRYYALPVPAKSTIQNLIRKFRNTGSVADQKRCGRPRSVITEQSTEEVALFFMETPTSTIRPSASVLQMSRSSLHRTLRALNLHPYRPTLLQALNEDDFDRRLQFCEVFLSQLDDDIGLVDKIIWTDEASFKLNGIVNRHNCVYWSRDNPHQKMEHVLNLPGLTVFGGISSAGLLGPFFFDGTVNGDRYLQLLDNNVWPILQNRPDINNTFWMQDGAPAHYDARVRAWLHQKFPNRWIGRRGPLEWPARSPDLTPPDFFLWSVIKEKVYKKKNNNLEELRQSVIRAFGEITIDLCRKVTNSVPERFRMCALKNGGHFEHYL